MIELNKFDDMAGKYKDEIIKLYQNQNNDDLQESEDEIMKLYQNNDDLPEPEYEPPVDNQEESILPVMPPAIAEQSNIYEKNNMGTGFLKVEVSSGNNAYPVENALVIITKNENGREDIMYILETDINGTTSLSELSAPLENGTEISDRTPYSYYNIIVYKPGYYEVQNKNAAVFSGITSIQPVKLIPLPAYTEENRVTTFYEQEPDL